MLYYRVYKNGSKSPTIVLETQKDVDGLVAYNGTMRFGCAQFVDGECVYPGYLNESEIKLVKLMYGEGESK